MKIAGCVGAIVMLAALAAPASAQTELSEPNAAVKACIASNAPAVDRAFESINEGTDFLIGKICSGELADQMRAEQEARSVRMKAEQEARRKEMCANQDKDDIDARNNPFNPQSYLAMMCNNPAADYMAGVSEPFYDSMFFNAQAAPKATALAAKTLLDLRVKRLGAKP